MTMSCRKSEPRLVRLYSACASGRKKNGPAGLIQIRCRIACISDHAYDLELTTRSWLTAEVFANGIFVSEKCSRERLINDGDASRARRILLGDAAPSDDGSPDDVKVARGHSIPRSGVVIPWAREGDARPPRRRHPNRRGRAASTGREPRRIPPARWRWHRGCGGRAARVGRIDNRQAVGRRSPRRAGPVRIRSLILEAPQRGCQQSRR